MDLALNETQKLIQQTARDFATRVILPQAVRIATAPTVGFMVQVVVGARSLGWESRLRAFFGSDLFMSYEETAILEFLSGFPEAFTARREIARRAMKRTVFEENPHWADAPLAGKAHSATASTPVPVLAPWSVAR